MGAGGALLVFLMRRFGRRWWAPAAALAVAFGVLMNYAGPIVLDPLFNKFKPLPAGELRSDVIEMAEEAGVKVGEVYEMDASRRTTAANAYVAGLGSTKRVVLYDTLLRDFTPEEVRLVVAHELGHVHHRDVPRGLLYLALVAPVGMFAVSRLAERWAPEGGPAAVPAVGLALALMVPAITIVSNQLSRAVEARADRYSIELTGEPDQLINFQKRITVQNVSDPEPPGWTSSCSARTRPPCSGSARPSRCGTRREPRHARDGRGHFAGSPLEPSEIRSYSLRDSCGARLGPRPPRSGRIFSTDPSGIRRRLAGRSLGEVLDPLLGPPLGPVVLHRVDQLAHEARRDADPRDDDAGDLLALDLVIDARERDRELVIRVRDVREVRVYPRHHLGRGVQIDVALGLIPVHAP